MLLELVAMIDARGDFGRTLLTGRHSPQKTDARLLLEYDADINVHGGDSDTHYTVLKSRRGYQADSVKE
jgi:hypothetical protein